MKMLKKLFIASLFGLMINPIECLCQWNNGLLPDIRTTVATRSVGVGFFTIINPPLSALNINVNPGFLTPSPNFALGDVFRTDGPSANTNIWHMFTGPIPGATEKFRLFSPALSNDIGLQTTQAGNMNILTNSILRAQFTTGAPLTNGLWAGDGLRIFDPTLGIGNLDIWTSGSNTTHIAMDGSGNLDGQNSRLELTGHYTGLWLDATPGTIFPALVPRMIFNINSVERARFNSNANNGFMRIGLNAGLLDAVRRLEVFDATNAPQFRIAQTAGTVFTDFQTTLSGDLYINPSASNVNRFVGINNPTPSNTLEITSTAGVSPELAGLRFTNLTNAAAPITNPSTGVLSVSKNGDVIFVTDVSGKELFLALVEKIKTLETKVNEMEKLIAMK